ncbi:hypothetical protein [Prescottella subtropica]|uniref:hypothetical protein n=1 Tax=Prescottella subtropica TaxID=2545757 RepID=UPI0010F76462|nr:hypothetical protein [Prescottella subtropica]
MPASERIDGDIRRWCDGARLDGRHAPLSDAAAVLVAAGRVDADIRRILAARRLAGRGLPSIGGFGELRLLADEHQRLLGRVASLRPGPKQLTYRYRAAEVGKRIDGLRTALTMSTVHYASGVRAIRRERRDGLHLDPEQRGALFDALARTPAPLPVARRQLHEMHNAMVEATAERMVRGSDGTRASDVGRRAAAALERTTVPDDDRFTDRFDTLLFLTGLLCDRIEGSAAWHSEHFALQRAQLDLADEVTQIAVDAVALSGIVAELDTAAASTPEARDHVTSRRTAIEPVWDQLVDRVAALARIGDLLSQAETQLRAAASMRWATSLDTRIDDLIARSGNRELSAANTRQVGDQLDEIETLLGTFRTALGGDIAALTARRER